MCVAHLSPILTKKEVKQYVSKNYPNKYQIYDKFLTAWSEPTKEMAWMSGASQIKFTAGEETRVHAGENLQDHSNPTTLHELHDPTPLHNVHIRMTQQFVLYD